MGSPLSPLMANAFLCSLEEKLERDNKLPYLYNNSTTLATESEHLYSPSILVVNWVMHLA